MEVYSSDNSGNRIPSDVLAADPVAGSGQSVSAASTDTNASITVKQGKMYAITCIKGAHIFGILTTATVANCIWACGSGHTIIIKIPMGTVLLHYQTPDSSRKFILRELAE